MFVGDVWKNKNYCVLWWLLGLKFKNVLCGGIVKIFDKKFDDLSLNCVRDLVYGIGV